ncbi:MAG: hypothetical protein OZ921_03550 [Sorangiineae bacterium]|nr:hypothetical protein [Polyangiaceae bacterium]MEB2321564.1 hypothetical protein [Sorangiineae bacterium]
MVDTPSTTFAARLRPHWLALLLPMLTLLFGFGLGIVFGGAEDSLKKSMASHAEVVLAEKYGGDSAKAEASVKKSWEYVKRAHLHAGGLGAAALALILLLALASEPSRITRGTALGLGLGALGYPVYWLLAGLAAPGLGGTKIAKEAFAWLGMPSAALVVLGTLLVTALVTRSLAVPPAAPR